MVIKELTIEHFGKIKRFEASFHEQLTEISDSNTNDIIQAIGLITANKSLTDHVARYFKRFDCIQFDEGNCANNINALQNSDVILIIHPKMTIRILHLTITL